MTVLSGHEARLDVAAPSPQAGYGVEASVGVSQGVQRDVGAAAGPFPHLFRHVRGPGRVHRFRRTYLHGHLQRVATYVHRDHPRSQRRRDRHRRQPDATASMHRHPVAPRHPALVSDRPKRGGETAAQASRRHEVHIVRQLHQRKVGVSQRHPLREAAPAVEPGLELALAHLLVAGAAVDAPPAPGDERHRHPVPSPPSGHLPAHVLDHAGDLVTRHVGQHDIRIVAHPAVPVASADAVRFDPQHHAVGRRLRVGQRLDGDRTPVLPVDCRLHVP